MTAPHPWVRTTLRQPNRLMPYGTQDLPSDTNAARACPRADANTRCCAAHATGCRRRTGPTGARTRPDPYARGWPPRTSYCRWRASPPGTHSRQNSHTRRTAIGARLINAWVSGMGNGRRTNQQQGGQKYRFKLHGFSLRNGFMLITTRTRLPED